jgi:hypothetical protein
MLQLMSEVGLKIDPAQQATILEQLNKLSAGQEPPPPPKKRKAK